MQGIASLPMDMAPEGEAPAGNAGGMGSLTTQEAATLGRLLSKVSQDEIEQLREIASDLREFSEPELRDFLGGVDYIMANSGTYKQSVRNLIAQGIVEPGDLPADYIPTFYSILRQMIVDALKETSAAEQVQGFAKGGLASMAKKVAAAGRHGDTMLAHITPREAQMLKQAGGAGTINPATGLVEYKSFWSKVGSFLKKAAPVILPVALSFIPGIGPAIGGALGFSGAMAGSIGSAVVGAVGSGVGGLIAGQKPGQALLSAALGGAGGFVLGGGLTGGEGISGLFSGGGTGATGAANMAASAQSGAAGINPTVASDFSGAMAPAAAPGAINTAVPTPPVRPAGLFLENTPVTTSEGGLGGLFGKVGNFVQQNPMTSLALAGGAGMLLGGMGGQQDQGAPTSFGPTGVELLRQNPTQYGFNLQNFLPQQGYRGGVVPTASPITAKAGGHIAGPGTGTSDDIPAMLSDGEFVLTAKAVRGAGDGSRMKGAKRLYKLMNDLEKRA